MEWGGHKEKKDFKDKPFGGTKLKTKKQKRPSALQENCLFGPFYKTKEQKAEKNKTTKKPKEDQKKHLFACWRTAPHFW